LLANELKKQPKTTTIQGKTTGKICQTKHIKSATHTAIHTQNKYTHMQTHSQVCIIKG